MTLVLHPHMTNHPSGSDSLITRKLVPSFNVETAPKSSSKLALPLFWYSFINSFFHHKKLQFIFLTFFQFHCTLFSWTCVNPRMLFSKFQFVHTLVCLITHSFPVGTLLLCMLYQWNNFQPRIGTWLYLRDTFTVHANSFHNLEPLWIICTKFQIQKLYWYMNLQ